ncbi:unnamed protein product [Symbiodinium natans]|uniref:KHDC4/BBP-like KH-domain type I domain-containing protein n=1 Tax=Symbiodinium natans TaxID=878477 RepID=A0A812MKM5_9DINO|nr:unnamed protein product [Symbiodinium natans]
MAIVDEFVTGVRPSVDTIYPSYPTYPSLGLHGQPWGQPWGDTPYQVLPSHLNRLLYGSLTLSESVSENGSEDYGSSVSGDVGRMELNGSPSSNVTIRPPPGLSQDIGEVAKVYPVSQLASCGLPFLPSPSGFANKKITAPPPPHPTPSSTKPQAAFQIFNFAVIFKGYDLEKHAAFELVPRLIGRNADNMKKIYKTGAGARVRGRGSGWKEVKSPHGNCERDEEPLQLAVSCRSGEIREAAPLELMGEIALKFFGPYTTFHDPIKSLCNPLYPYMQLVPGSRRQWCW